MHDKAVRNIVEAAAAVFDRYSRAKGTDVAELLHDFVREVRTLRPIFDVGRYILLDEIPEGGTNELWLFRQQIVQLVKIGMIKIFLFHGLFRNSSSSAG